MDAGQTLNDDQKVRFIEGNLSDNLARNIAENVLIENYLVVQCRCPVLL